MTDHASACLWRHAGGRGANAGLVRAGLAVAVPTRVALPSRIPVDMSAHTALVDLPRVPGGNGPR